jgi:hypothetical protein
MTDGADGIWRAERLESGAWVASRTTIDKDLHHTEHYERDGRWHRGEFYPRFFDTFDQATKRCDELNGEEP